MERIFVLLLDEIPKVDYFWHHGRQETWGKKARLIPMLLLHQWRKGRLEQVILWLCGRIGVAEHFQSCVNVKNVGWCPAARNLDCVAWWWHVTKVLVDDPHHWSFVELQVIIKPEFGVEIILQQLVKMHPPTVMEMMIIKAKTRFLNLSPFCVFTRRFTWLNSCQLFSRWSGVGD